MLFLPILLTISLQLVFFLVTLIYVELIAGIANPN